jgi:hypothetical protein
MDKHKLVRIIAKDLEELRTLTEEVSENENSSSLIIDLALSRARLLCQELELLRSFSTPEDSLKDEIENENFEDGEDEVTGMNISEPELEILHFEEQDFPESVELTEEDDEMVVYNEEDEELEEELEDEIQKNLDEDEDSEENNDLTEDIEEDEDVQNDESEDEDVEEDEFASIEEDELEDEEPEFDEAEEESEPEEVVSENHTEKPIKPVEQSVRQIEIDDLDDEEDESVQFSPVSNSANRMVMREIPKPEIPLTEDEEPEEQIPDETIQKERSLNETLGENKAAETNLSNSPITSLRATIGLNDRFLFIREIFNNNSEKYNTIIDQLDQMETIQQAVDYLKVNLSLQKNETSLKFVELLKRRFSK